MAQAAWLFHKVGGGHLPQMPHAGSAIAFPKLYYQMVIFSGITVKIHQNHVYSHLIFQNFPGGPVGMPPDSLETLYFAIRSVTYSSRGVGTGPVGPDHILVTKDRYTLIEHST